MEDSYTKIRKAIEVRQKTEEYQKQWKEYVDGQPAQAVTINFTCSISQSTNIQFPVILERCRTKKMHIDQYFELQSLIAYYEKQEGKNIYSISELKCPQCKESTPIKNQEVDKAFVYHQLVNNLRQQFGQITIPMQYYFKEQKAIPIYSGNLGRKDQLIHDQQMLEIFKLPKNDNQQFIFKVNQIERVRNGESVHFYSVCLLGKIRTTIPVRGKLCKHLECYDLLYFLKHCKEKKDITTIACVYPGCETLIKKSELCIDYDLYQASLKGFTFSFAFIYDPQYKCLQDIITYSKLDPNIISYRNQDNDNKNNEYQRQIYLKVDQIYNDSNHNENKTKNFYSSQPLMQELELKSCPFTKLRIEIPSRCIQCKELKVCDLRYLCCILETVQYPEDSLGIRDKKTTCPLCKSEFKRKKRPNDLSLPQQVYVDTQMMEFIARNLEINISLEQYMQYLKKEETQQIKITETEESPITKVAFYTLKIICPITKETIQHPVRGAQCTHREVLDEGIVKLHNQKQIDLFKMNCPIEKCGKSLSHLVRDIFLSKLLNQFYNEIMHQNCQEVQIKTFNQKTTIKAKI